MLGAPTDLTRTAWLTRRPVAPPAKKKGKKKETGGRSKVDRRWFTSDGFHVQSYDKYPGDPAAEKPTFSFDLRDVEALRPALDATATAVDVIVGRHAFTLDFGFLGERDSW